MKHNHIIVLLFMLIGIHSTFAQAPKIASFSPRHGAIGTLVAIRGSGFSPMADSNVVNFGATRARVTYASANQLSVIVPAGATFKPITVSNKITRLIAHSSLPFSTSFYPANTDVDKPVRFAKDTGASDVKIGDIDGDGKPDIIATSPILKLLMVYRNISTNGRIGKNSFAPPIVYKTGPQSGFVAVEDLDGDGKIDIALINGSYNNGVDGYNSLTFFHNLSTPGHVKLSAFPAVDSSKTSQPNNSFKLNNGDNYAKIADFDGDGKPDLAVLNTAGYVTLYRNIYQPGQANVWAKPVKFPVGLHPTSISIGDMDGDGKPDIVTANSDSSSITLLRNTSVAGVISTTSFNRADFPLGYRPFTASLGDVDGDGKLDVLIARADGKPSMLIHNTSTPGNFNGSVVSLANLNMVSNFNNDMLIQDIDGDGKPDLISINARRDSVYLYTNKATAGQSTADYLNTRADFAIAALPDCIGDLDGDGRPDMVVSTRFGIDVYHSKAAPLQLAALPLALSADSLSVYQVLSPNGDGVNDVFAINNIQKFPDNHLTIINVNGAKVFEASGYDNQTKVFDGHSSITGIRQKQGTYFYRLEYKGDGLPKVKSGYFVLKY